jgi:hypothetical protein
VAGGKGGAGVKSPENYDLEALHDAEIAPLMDKVIAICKREKIPMVASFAYSKTDQGENCCTTSINRDGWQPREFVDAVNIIRNGFLAKAYIARML